MRILYTSILAVLLILGTSADNPSPLQLFQFSYENILGTSFDLKLTARSEYIASEAGEAALNEIGRLSDILNTCDPQSEFSRWQKTLEAEVPVSPELFEVMTMFEDWQVCTGGALNPAVGAATAIWKKADETDTFPTEAELAQAVEVLNKRHWILDEDNMTARHLTTDPLIFNTFVKGYIIGRVSDRIMEIPGVSSSLVNIGGDMVVRGDMKEKIGIADPDHPSDNYHPVSAIKISDKAVATSGNYRRGFNVGGEWYSHILDARTAIPAKEVISATVVSDDPVEAGAMATAFNILSPEESWILAKQTEGIDFLIITEDGRHFKSDGWDELAVNDEKESSPSEKLTDFELKIEIELARFEGRSLRPYVAVWVEDENSVPVRTLALWFNNYRWLPDLRRWYAKHYEKSQQFDFMQSVTSATRSAGKYSLYWDLTDDNNRTVKPGKYTVHIEASRERGTYQLMSKEIELNNKAKRLDITGGVEVTSAALDYSKVNRNNASL